jgi:hypothetical protein
MLLYNCTLHTNHEERKKQLMKKRNSLLCTHVLATVLSEVESLYANYYANIIVFADILQKSLLLFMISSLNIVYENLTKKQSPN